MKGLLTTTMALGVIFTLSNIHTAQAWEARYDDGYQARGERPASSQQEYVQPARWHDWGWGWDRPWHRYNYDYGYSNCYTTCDEYGCTRHCY